MRSALTGRDLGKLEAASKRTCLEKVLSAKLMSGLLTTLPCRPSTILSSEMQGLDLLVINAGVLFQNPKIWNGAREEETVRVNALGFAAMANVGSELLS